MSISRLHLQELGLEWFDYLEVKLRSPINDAAIIKRFKSSLETYGSQTLSITDFPKILETRYNIESAEKNSLCRAVYNGHLGMINYLCLNYPHLIDLKDKKGYSSHNVALKRREFVAFQILQKQQEKFDFCT